MTCRYILDGKTFNSEVELDEYLLRNSKLNGKDYVFQHNRHKWEQIQDDIREVINKSTNEVAELKRKKEITESSTEGEPNDLDNLKGGKTYATITDLIQKIQVRDEEGVLHPLFPIFRGDKYWDGTATSEGQKSLYRRGDFSNPKVKDQLKYLDGLITYIGGIPQQVTDERTLSKIRERMEQVWKEQSFGGNLVHGILSDFYTGRKDKTWFSKLPKEELLPELKKKIESDEGYKKYRKYLDDDDNVLNSIIDVAYAIDKSIHDKYGNNCMILSEKSILGQGQIENNAFPIVGKLDLLIITEKGKLAILDFKCSPKEYLEDNIKEDPAYYDPAKVLTFKYQLAAYRRLLQTAGITGNGVIDLGVIPIKFENFRFNSNKNQVEFDKVSIEEKDPIKILSNTSYSLGGDSYLRIEENLNGVFPRDIDDSNIDEILTKVEEEENILFKTAHKRKHMTTKDISEYIKNKGGIKKNKNTGKWEFRDTFNENEAIKIDGNKTKEEAEIAILEKLKAKFEYKENIRQEITSSIRRDFEQFYEDGTPIDFTKLSIKASLGSTERPLWNQEQFSKYTNPTRYKLINKPDLNPVLDHLGVLLFENLYTGLIDVVKISDFYDPTMKTDFGKNRTTLLGNFMSDDLVKSTSNNQVLEGVQGNIELMETMLILNHMSNLFKNSSRKGIGKIEVVSPRAQKGLTASNEQLLYNFRRLTQLGGIKNNFENTIKMASFVEICRSTFDEILQSQDYNYGLGKISRVIKDRIVKCISDLDDLGDNPIELRQQLTELDKDLVRNYSHLNKEGNTELSEDVHPEYKLHRDILFAIAELSGVKLLQQLEDHAKWSLTWEGGFGTEIDNPGTLQSQTLNEFTDQVTIAYQNVRDNVIAFNQELRKRVEALKKSKGFGLLKQYTIGNQVSDLYINMYDKNSKDLLFVNPYEDPSLTPEERDFLIFALLKINSNRYSDFDPKQLEINIKKNPQKYLKVPLIKGDMASEVAVRDGWLDYIRHRFMLLMPSKLKARLDKMANNLQDTKYENNWEAINFFDATDNEGEKALKTRENLITDNSLGGKAFFEHNVETLLLKHTSAYKMAEELNNIFPVLRALTINLNLQGTMVNKAFKNDLEYIMKYIKTRIHNQPIENREDTLEAVAADTTKAIMSTASKLALAFNPRQWYQFIDGLWKDIQIYIRSTGDTPFTKEGLLIGWKTVFSDLVGHFGNSFSLSELLNQQYGFNDMDANSYIDRIKTDNTGLLYHFWNVGFRFASRPDFYNRMTLFYAQMHKDGSLKAHKVVDGKLVYDWKEDERFKAFATDDKLDTKKYNQAKSAFIAIAQQLEKEGVRNADGSLYQLDMSKPILPKAYSNKDSESFKALSDRIYGYYAHEKKSMIHSSLVGSLFMQMNTYWSAKKNQYIQKRQYTQEGYWTDYEEDGFKYCWKEDEDGRLIPIRITDPSMDTGVPVKVWKGRPQEGIALTMLELGKALFGKSSMTNKAGFVGVWDLFTNENIDPDIRRLYTANVRQLFSDLFIWLIIGRLLLGSMESQVKEYTKDNSSFGRSLGNTALSTTYNMLTLSTEDANFMTSIFARGKDWTPFAIKAADRISTNFIRVLTGKQDLYDFIVKSSGAGNTTQPVWDYVKMETLDRKIGQIE